MKTELRTKLLDALKLTRPDIGKDYLYERCVNKYVDAMLVAISNSLSINHKTNEFGSDYFSFPQAKTREEIGTIGKKQEYIYQVMKGDLSTSLVIVIRKGYSKNGVSKLSMVAINPIYKELIMDELLNLRLESTQKLLDEIEQDWNCEVNIDPVSLASFIKKTTATIKSTTNGDAYKDKLLRNLTAARQLQVMTHPADETHSTPYVKERWEMADSGRLYGQGYSLQRMPKEVRHAALGVCHKYDFKACAFAIMAGLATAIDPSIKVGAILEYVKNRQAIRTRIAEQLNLPESVVKTIFTALGFGAELKNNQHNAIRGALAQAARKQQDTTVRLDRAIYNNLGADEFKRLVFDTTFGYIYEELQQINKTIIDYFKTHNITTDYVTYSQINPKTGKKRNDRQKLAWIYQSLESMAMRQFAEFSEQAALLTTHDCVYFKRRLPAHVVLDATFKLQQTFPYLRFEHEAIFPIVDDAEFAARFSEADRFELEHKQRIAEQTEIAKLYCAAKEQALRNVATAHSAFSSASACV